MRTTAVVHLVHEVGPVPLFLNFLPAVLAAKRLRLLTQHDGARLWIWEAGQAMITLIFVLTAVADAAVLGVNVLISHLSSILHTRIISHKDLAVYSCISDGLLVLALQLEHALRTKK